MSRLLHGTVATTANLQDARTSPTRRSADVALEFAVTRSVDLQDFDFLFPELQRDAASLLPESSDTLLHLMDLGRSMEDPSGDDTDDANIPAASTYFGQFMDHDITLEVQPADLSPSISDSAAAGNPDRIVRRTS